ncbi:hypothetical protein Tco_1392410 [Tanacetum coccineum]
MAGPTDGGGPEDQDDREATPPLTKEQIEGHLSALRSIIKDHNRKNKTYPIQLDFDEDETTVKDTRIAKGKEVVDDDLKKPFKEALKIPLTRRIIEFTAQPTLASGPCQFGVGCFSKLSMDQLGDGSNAFRPTTSMNGWKVETGFIMRVPEIMKISSFMDSLKCPELAKRFSDKAPRTVNKMMKRGRDNRPPCHQPRRDYQARVVPVLTLDALTKHFKEILATKTQLRLAPLRPMINPQRGGNMDRFCDYHQQKGHHTNDYHHLRRQLEAALESGKLNHLIKDVRQRGRGNQMGDGP